MDKLLTSEFWQSQWAVVMTAPWLILPLLAVVAFIAWRVRAAVDDGEVRGLRAKNDLLESQLEAAREEQPDFVEQLASLKAEVSDLRSQIRAGAGREVLDTIAATVESTATAVSDTGGEIARVIRAEPGLYRVTGGVTTKSSE